MGSKVTAIQPPWLLGWLPSPKVKGEVLRPSKTATGSMSSFEQIRISNFGRQCVAEWLCELAQNFYSLNLMLFSEFKWSYLTPDLRSGDLEFSSRPDHLLDLFQLVPGSTPRLHVYIANWSVSHQLGFLTCSVYFSRLFHWPWKAPVGRGQSSIHYIT